MTDAELVAEVLRRFPTLHTLAFCAAPAGYAGGLLIEIRRPDYRSALVLVDAGPTVSTDPMDPEDAAEAVCAIIKHW